MPVNLGDGPYIAYMGMSLVFITLTVFLLILILLRRLFPVQEASVAIESNVNMPQVEVLSGRINKNRSETLSSEMASVVDGGSSAISTPGQKIAAMSVALYMAMEKDQTTANVHQMNLSDNQLHGHTNWTIQGRTSLWDSQGRRPAPYNNKNHSAYSQEDLS